MAQQQSSRLNRLLSLLDTGSTQSTRFSAARQIGDIARSHPQDLASLLKKVAQYLHSKNWDTRVAAAQAIGAIAQNVKHTSLSELFATLKAKMAESGITADVEEVITLPSFQSKLVSAAAFKSFNLNKVLEFGALLASRGQEFDVSIDNSRSPMERLARQKQNLRRRLGLDVCEQFMDVNDMIKDEDLMVQKILPQGNGLQHGIYSAASVHNIQRLVSKMVPSVKRPSARELNLLKRKAKNSSKDQGKAWSEGGDKDVSGGAPPTPPPTATTILKGSAQDSSSFSKIDVSLDDDGADFDSDAAWPFSNFVEQLILDMFDPVWEVRHGSIMALREILTHHGDSAGIFLPSPITAVRQNTELKEDTKLLPPEDGDYSCVVKSGRSIDLNAHACNDSSEPSAKKIKIEGAVSSPKDDQISSGDYVNLDVPVRIADGEGNLCDDRSQLAVSGGLIEVKAEAHPNGGMACDGAVMLKTHSHVKDPPSHLQIVESHPEGPELMNLIELSKVSWLKNCEFLQDCAVRFLCVLSLDRFGDYVSDQVVAPVRETCAQALGAAFKYMHPSLVWETLKILLQMQHRHEWEIRHGSLLGIKYLIAVRQDMLHDLLGHVLPACKSGLEDPDDDVRAVAADALIPAAASIVNLNGQTLHVIVMLLWDILLDLDDLSPSTSSVMNLLAEIYSQEKMFPQIYGNSATDEQELDLNDVFGIDDPGRETQENPYMLSSLAPRLWPFMRHSISSVRLSAIRTLERLLDACYKRSSSGTSKCSFWPSFILGDTIRIVFQNLLLKSNEQILESSERVWRLLMQCPVEDLETVSKSYMCSWIELAATPYGSQLDAQKMFWPVAAPRRSHFKAAAKVRAVKIDNDPLGNSFDLSRGAFMLEKNGVAPANSIKIVVGTDVEMSVTHMRVVSSSALGILASRLREEYLPCIIEPLWNALTSLSGVQRQVASIILISWFKEIKRRKIVDDNYTFPGIPEHFKNWMLDLLTCLDPALPTKDSPLPYSELSRTYAKMHSEASQLIHAVESSGNFVDELSSVKNDIENLSVDDAIKFAYSLTSSSNDSAGSTSSGKHVLDEVESVRQRLLTTSGYLKCIQNNLHISVSALVAAAVVWMSDLPAKLNPIILPLMASVKREQEEILQQMAAEALAELISCCISRKPSPNEKLIRNLCALTCMDPQETPQAGVVNTIEMINDQFLSSSSTSNKHKSKLHMLAGGEDRSRIEGFLSRRGSERSLRYLSNKFGASLFDSLPKLWDCLTEVLKPANHVDDKEVGLAINAITDPQILVNNIQVVRSVAPMLHGELKSRVLKLLPCIFKFVRHSHVAVRLSASRCITSMAKSMTVDMMAAVIENVMPMLGDMTSVHARQGAGMLISFLVQGLGSELVPYAPLLVVPLLRCMSDCDTDVRHSVTHSFATLVPLLPLSRGLPRPPGISDSFSSNAEDARFLVQLLDNSHIDDYQLSTELKVTLRRYQQEGINWLGFLKRFKLHGILCDDMGLGKTLQASAIMASDIAEHRISRNDENLPPSLIVCPSTLVGHWAFEIEKYIDISLISTLQYVGSAPERVSIRDEFEKHNVIITSYDVVRKDIDFLGQLMWNYCILDEGHIIKNSRSKITSAVKQLKAQHRLILSGTPIQNNIMDLWSLFDFLMPGFLGTERQFQATYGKPLLAARDPKCSAKDAEAGVLAMEALHKQAMPFLLRRTKDEVLSDLPEKIIQDRYCDLSPVQLKLYEQFSGSQAKQEISTMVKDEHGDSKDVKSASSRTSSHVFQALQYLLKLCSHPLLVIGEKIPDSLECCLSKIFPGASDIMSELHNLHHSPKLVALQEILEECGIGLDISSSEGALSAGQHRVLIFAQHKALLDIIERDLFHTHMKNVTYLRLDGSVVPEKRFDIVKAFNSDPTIDALLLTTHVGGLGLNLTSADTLIFMEHDWNPMRDHQAMDRAHRLGQQKVVHVHRLIMRGTLEEKVMSLQKFKVSVANAVINADNASLNTMNTDQLLDLFASAETGRKGSTQSRRVDENSQGDCKGSGRGLKAVLGGLEELWDQSQYTEEYNLSRFLAKLNG
ncbi:hypothetical protein MLD38_018674 [Melastoma candidum]|uniref:Uncharacterized protein n=1 Tax=Melastoma candidum TaxID=119954 RepID=A0ACB9QXP0_9MYRT|nr:hypothetical protein MLD38_018674 [Melastoma candidum]